MCDTYISDKKIKPRKNHRCRVCNERIIKGEECYSYTGAGEGRIYTLYFHNECWAYTSDWDCGDWETSSPGEVLRKDILEALDRRNDE